MTRTRLSVEQLLSQAESLANQFDQGGRTTKKDIDAAITLDREALTLCPPGHDMRSSSLTRLSNDLSTRYAQFGAIEDIEEGIILDREALTLRPLGHPDRGMSLNNLGFNLSTRYEQFGAISDLDEAIVLGREVLALRARGHPLRSSCLDNLGAHLSDRYDKLGAISDLDEAIVLARESLALLQRGHPNRSGSLGNLGIYLSDRYHKLGILCDLDEAIVLCREAATLRPQGHPGRSKSLNNLARCLSIRYVKLGATSDLNEATVLHQEALALHQQGHPLRPMALNNLARCLSIRYAKFGATSDLNEAIVLQQEALVLCPRGNPLRPSSLDNLASCLSDRYDKLGAMSDLNEAIVLSLEALALRPQGHPLRWSSLESLTYLLTTRYKLNTSSGDLEEAFCLYAQYADVSYTVSSGDLEGARTWIHAAEEFRHSSTCLAYETYLRLLVEHLPLLPSLPQYLTILKEHTSSIAVNAFSACLRNGAPKRAVELLEQGCSVFWNQLTRLHSSLDDVIASGPTGEKLAKKFNDLTELIRNALHSPEKEQHDYICHLNLRMQNIVTAIHKLPGLSRFLLPSLFSDLQHAAREGPVIIVNASQYGCDALIVIDNHDPIHIPLSITREYVRLLSSKFLGLPRRANSRDVTNALIVILQDLWDIVVSQVVRFLQTFLPLRSRIWWCPTAEFSDLPLHAAGSYRRGQQNLPDLYISSYTPTLGALARARRTDASKSGSDARHFIAIGQASAVGERKLLSVSSELARIGEDVRGATKFRQIEGEESRIPLVAEELKKNEWVHLACHGIPNRKAPFKSAFALRDGHFTIEQIIRCELENPEFAYLSACRTTVGDEESPDESIHLASAMQFLGFRSVIGTMWSVDDKATNAITSRFYKLMLDESGRLDYKRAAFALNETMRTVPKSEVTLDQRVLYIHIGA